MRHVLLVTCLSAIFCQSAFAVSTAWLHEPPGSTLISDWPFDNITGGGWTAPWGVAGQILPDPTAPLSPSNGWRNTRSATSNNGTDLLCAIPPANQTEVYFGFWFKPSDPHSGWTMGVGYQKIGMINQAAPHIYTIMKNIDRVKGLFTLIGWEERAVMVPDSTNFHVTPNGELWPNINGGYFRVGQWHKMEIYVKKSATSTSRDGKYMWWVDDTLRGHYTNLNWEIPTWGVSLGHVWDRLDTGLPITEWVQYDHARVSLPVNGEPHPVYLVISTAGLSSARKDVAYSATLQTLNMGTTTPFTWTISDGALPAGLSLGASTGTISGIPTCTGRSDFTVRVTDASQPMLSATKSYSVVVSGSGCTSGIEGMKELAVNGLQLTAEPRMTSVTFRISQSGSCSIAVYDLSGREVWRHTGRGGAVWNHGGSLRKGVYLVRAEQNGKSISRNYCHVW